MHFASFTPVVVLTYNLVPILISFYPLHLLSYPSGLWKNCCILVWFTVFGICDLSWNQCFRQSAGCWKYTTQWQWQVGPNLKSSLEAVNK